MEKLYSVQGQVIDPSTVYSACLGNTTLEGRVKGVVVNKLVLQDGVKHSPGGYEFFEEEYIPFHKIKSFAPVQDMLFISVPDSYTSVSQSPQSPWGRHAVLQESYPPSGSRMPAQP